MSRFPASLEATAISPSFPHLPRVPKSARRKHRGPGRRAERQKGRCTACREPKGELQMPQTRGPEKTGRLPSRGTEGRGPPPAPAGGPGRLSDPSFRLSLRPDPGFLHPCRLLLEKSSGPIAGKIRCHTLDAFPSALSADSVFKGSVLYRKEVGPLDPSLCQYNQVGPVFSPGSIMIYTDMRSCLQAWDTS